jgi:hypothetical protein
VQLELFDLSGRLVLLRNWNASSLPVSMDFAGNASGIYFYRILGGGAVVQGKVVKK